MVISLKRFKSSPPIENPGQNNAHLANMLTLLGGGGHGVKINTPISFPLQNLELSEYLPLPSPSGDELNKQTDNHDENDMKKIAAPSYDLFGVVNHHGTMGLGHYTAMVKASLGESALGSESLPPQSNFSSGSDLEERRAKPNTQWYLFDDASVKPAKEADVVHPSAYVLFYRRRS
jgi:hypothetical protein